MAVDFYTSCMYIVNLMRPRFDNSFLFPKYRHKINQKFIENKNVTGFKKHK